MNEEADVPSHSSLIIPHSSFLLRQRLGEDLYEYHREVLADGAAHVRRAPRHDDEVALLHVELLPASDAGAAPLARLDLARRLKSPAERERRRAFEHVVNVVRGVVDFGRGRSPVMLVLDGDAKLSPLAAGYLFRLVLGVELPLQLAERLRTQDYERAYRRPRGATRR